jgi:hypothetical protein
VEEKLQSLHLGILLSCRKTPKNVTGKHIQRMQMEDQTARKEVMQCV